jgi:DNA-binding response OmpR family regulator
MNENTIRVLLVEDNVADARLLREMLNEPARNNYELTHCESMAKAVTHLLTKRVDVVLLDLGLPDSQGLAALGRAHGAAPQVPLVVLTGLDDEALAMEALQAGAQDYLFKGQIDARGLTRALRYAIERKAMDEALSVERERAQVTLNCIGDAVISTEWPGHLFQRDGGKHDGLVA